MSAAINIARYELLVVRRNLWVAIAVGLMSLFAVVLTLAGSAPAGELGVDRLTISITSLTTLSVYLVPLIALLLSFDAITGELDRGTLALTLAYPVSKAAFLLGKLAAHLLTLTLALAIGFGIAGLLSAALGETSPQSLGALAGLFVSAVLLGATFLGLGYAVSAVARQSGAAAGLVIGLWLVGIVLYDLGLLGALVADEGGFFTARVFPWLLVANPADSFRLVNLASSEVAMLSSGLAGGNTGLPALAPQLAILLWPVIALAAAWRLFRRIEP
jgi:Cu-processing system permease protein